MERIPGIIRRQLPIGFRAILAGLILVPHAFAQSVDEHRPQFEVASIRASDFGRKSESIRQIRRDGLTFTNRTLFEYIYTAYDVAPFQVVHGPAISLADRYDIVAKAASPVTPAQLMPMLRSLLEDRFKLGVHREIRELHLYALTVAKGGARFQASQDDGPMAAGVQGGLLHYKRTSMAYLAGSLLSNLPSLGRLVVDRTGLDGLYDFSLRLFDPDAGNSETNSKGDTLRQIDSGLNVSLKDLGLKLEAQTGPIEFVVVDHVEKPSEN